MFGNSTFASETFADLVVLILDVRTVFGRTRVAAVVNLKTGKCVAVDPVDAQYTIRTKVTEQKKAKSFINEI
jgi:hypothetical protein